MNALLLPGNSSRHATWIEDFKSAVSSHFDATKTQHYQHWQTGEEWANVDQEISIAKEQARELEPYIIIGKSIGTIIAAKATATGKLFPEKLILLGVPINGGAEPDTFANWLTHIKIPVTIIQNTNDPMGSFAEITENFKDVGDHVSFVELPCTTHNYLDFEAIAELI